MNLTHTNVVLNSGGMDTFLMSVLFVPADAVHVFVNVGQKYMYKEQTAARAIAKHVGAKFHVMRGADQSQFEDDESGIIPFRNAELILNAAQHGDNIYMGILSGEINSDKSPEFLEAITNVLNISHRPQYWTAGRRFELRTPVAHFTKTQLVKRYLKVRQSWEDIDALLSTVSCYSSTDQHCGQCASCFKRWVALVNNDVPFPGDHFALDPAQWQHASYWKERVLQYDWERRAEVTEALMRAGVQL